MKEAPVHQLLQKIISTCKRNSILHPEFRQNEIVGVRYGPLGYLLKRNIYREWLSSCLNNSDVHIFPVHIQRIVPVQHSESNAVSKKMLLQEVSEQCQSVTSMNYKLPYGLAISCEQSESSEGDHISSEIIDPKKSKIKWKLRKYTNLCIAFLCAPSKSTHWFYYWQRQRYVWWRKFASIPSQFIMSDMVQNSPGEQQVSLQFQFPWNVSKIEDMMQVHPDQLKCMDIYPPNGDAENGSLSSVFCSADLDLAVFAYLCNAFSEKHRHGKVRTVLQLHHKLAPYKVAVVVASNIKKLNEVSYLLTKELKKSGITVFPNLESMPGHVETDFIRFDEMGLPYCVVLTEASLITGIALLRNRDTTLQEQIHLTELTAKLLRYLQMIVPS